MASQELTIKVRIDGLNGVIAALRKLPKDASNELRDAALRISKELAASAKTSGRSEGRQAAIVAATVRAARDRVPVVVAGGNRKIGRNRQPAYKLLFGSEFGASRLHQYKPHLGRGSYWFFRTIEDEQVTISAEWLKAADEVIAKFGGAV